MARKKRAEDEGAVELRTWVRRGTVKTRPSGRMDPCVLVGTAEGLEEVQALFHVEQERMKGEATPFYANVNARDEEVSVVGTAPGVAVLTGEAVRGKSAPEVRALL